MAYRNPTPRKQPLPGIQCPECGVFNSGAAARCACGFNFQTQHFEPTDEQRRIARRTRRKRRRLVRFCVALGVPILLAGVTLVTYRQKASAFVEDMWWLAKVPSIPADFLVSDGWITIDAKGNGTIGERPFRSSGAAVRHLVWKVEHDGFFDLGNIYRSPCTAPQAQDGPPPCPPSHISIVMSGARKNVVVEGDTRALESYRDLLQAIAHSAGE